MVPRISASPVFKRIFLRWGFVTLPIQKTEYGKMPSPTTWDKCALSTRQKILQYRGKKSSQFDENKTKVIMGRK
ncbi:ANM_HP_G0048960.mRNA.1.CDS.1 [Saccharomyces cerevisiae]|nr:ANM_HP_G0048960.mRNA.1.CDS.1 [Saccharomyces cerevisiae]CAI7027586.1 ANM_HP_G0048960.mRNA.1.CDS.1 [Saccharomyces cerevisiae]